MATTPDETINTPGHPNGPASAANFTRGTFQYRLLNDPLPTPPKWVDRGSAHEAPEQRDKERILSRFRDSVRTIIKSHLSGSSMPYSKLKEGEIRLLCLHKGKEDDRLEATLFARKLEDVKDGYEALSYCWGTDREKEYIWIQDLNPALPASIRPRSTKQRNLRITSLQSAVKTASGYFDRDEKQDDIKMSFQFPVKASLHQALRRLRREESEVYLWVDAICIDQSDAGKLEKEGQLAMMAEIYNYASNICIWLGDEFPGAAEGKRLIKDIMNFKNFDSLLETPESRTRWSSLIEMMKAPWFTRRWIIQEIALSKNATIFCKDQVVHWDDFADAVSLLTEKIHSIRANFKDEIFDDVENTSSCVLVHTLTNICRKADEGNILGRLLDMETLVSTFLRFEATYPRDTIYSILSLAKDAPPLNGREGWEEIHNSQLRRNDFLQEQVRRRRLAASPAMISLEETMSSTIKKKGTQLTPNYNLSTRDLFIAFVTRCIKKSGSLDVICRHWAPEVIDTTFGETVFMPSWVSSISKSPYGGAGRSGGRQNGENFVAYTPNDQRRRYNASGDELKASIEMIDDPALVPPVLQTKTASIVAIDQQIGTPPIIKAPPGKVTIDSSSGLEHGEKGSKHLVSGSMPSKPLRLGISDDHTSKAMSPIEEETEASLMMTANNFPHDKAAEIQKEHPNDSRVNEPNGDNSLPAELDKGIHIIHGQAPDIQLPSRRHRGLKIPYRMSSELAGTNNSTPSESTPTRKYVSARKPDVEREHSLSGIMAIEGFILGTISALSDVMRGGIVPGDWISAMGWDGEQNENRPPDVLWRLLCADRARRGGKPPQWYKRACLHGLVDSRVTDYDGTLHSSMPNDRSISEHTTRYFNRVASVVWNRRLIQVDTWPAFRLDGGPCFGLAPRQAGEEDLVCILFGCSVPVVLKRVKDPRVTRLFELVGECYVDGFMDGEAVQDQTLVDSLKTKFFLA